ncbi:hypothetical protein SAMN05444128_3975 [Pontibacter indicus]|uniref:Uncharacterized protein n=2 Tax=Pontibacter indicus TaxID=1317125 RepID=A0A1R3XTM0_9BACT|nr:hypothetical protein SAMN05444128_3975 [Pontibacter indicus]
MLTQFSWHQFALSVGACLLLYYTVVTLLLYRRPLRAWLSRGPASRQASRPAATPDVMGPVLSDTSSLLPDAAALVVAPAPPQEPVAAALQPDDVRADLLAELQDLLDLAAGNLAGKEDFCQLVRLVISRYAPALPGVQDQVNRFLLEQGHDRLPFALSAADLQACWPTAAGQG